MFVAFKTSVFSLLLVSIEASLRLHRHLSQEKINSFTPITQVTDHAAIDLDQQEIELHLANGEYSAAQSVYTQGAHSKSFAVLTLSSALSTAVPKGTSVEGTSVDGDTVSGAAYRDFNAGETTLEVQYSTTDIQASYVSCQVGGSSDPVLGGCFQSSGSVSVNGQSYTYTYDPNTDNNNGRTIQGFSTDDSKHKVNGSGEYYKDFAAFVEYYGATDYGDKWVSAALTATNARLARGNADFTSYGDDGRVDAIKKGTAYLNIFMYVIREMEDAIDDCNKGCERDECNDDAVHALDEAVAFYGGSLLSTDSGDGNLLYALAEKRCENFNTCTDGESKVNAEIFVQFRKMQDDLLKKQCDAARKDKERIAELMYVPMIQGTLRYAYFAGEQNDTSEKSEAEGATFAAAVLPMVHACSESDASTIYDNMRVGNGAPVDFAAVKRAFERNYGCMGITCDDVGGLHDGADYFPKAAPCGSSSSSSEVNAGVVVGVIIGVVAALGLISVFICRRRRSGVEFKSDSNNAAAPV